MHARRCASPRARQTLDLVDHVTMAADPILPPAAVCTRPPNRANLTVAAPGVRLLVLGFHEDSDAHAVAVARGEHRPIKHASGRALLGRCEERLIQLLTAPRV